MHLLIEAWLNCVPVDESSAEMALFLQFVHTLGHVSAFGTEWTIYGESEQLVGSIDVVAMDDEGHLVLFDWKRSKDLRTKYCNKFQGMCQLLIFYEI